MAPSLSEWKQLLPALFSLFSLCSSGTDGGVNNAWMLQCVCGVWCDVVWCGVVWCDCFADLQALLVLA